MSNHLNAGVLHEHIWRSALTIEYLAEEELGVARQEGEDLLVVLFDTANDATTYKVGYRRDVDGYTWPSLTTHGDYTAAASYESFVLVSGSAKRETFENGRLRKLVGPSVVRAYAEHMRTIEKMLSNTATSHFLDFAKTSKKF